MKVIDLVIPCYNEEEVLKEISSRLYEKMGRLIGNKILFQLLTESVLSQLLHMVLLSQLPASVYPF